MKGMKPVRVIFEETISEKGITKSSIAKKLGATQQAFQKRISKNHFSSDFIETLCIHTGINFFQLLANEFEKTKVENSEFDLINELAKKSAPLDDNQFLQYLKKIDARIDKMEKNNLELIKDNTENKKLIRENLKAYKEEKEFLQEKIKAKETELQQLKRGNTYPTEYTKHELNEPTATYKKK